MNKINATILLMVCLFFGLGSSMPSVASTQVDNYNSFDSNKQQNKQLSNEELVVYSLAKSTEIENKTVPNYIIPSEEISYDNGIMANGSVWVNAGGKYAVRMSLSENKDNAIIKNGLFAFQSPLVGNNTNFEVEVWDASGDDGFPGELLAGPIPAEAKYGSAEWTVVDLTEYNIKVTGDFYMVAVQTEGLASAPVLGLDRSEFSWRNYSHAFDKPWKQGDQPILGNYMIRAQIGYEVPKPEITIPEEGLITNRTSIKVSGKSYSDTAVDSNVKLLNNGVQAGTVKVTDEGDFSISIDLSEGENEIVAISVINGEEVIESEPITVIKDTENPELTIDSPSDNDNTNREVITVKGTVTDENLDSVQVNGQYINSENNGTYAKRILLDNGENKVEVIATDKAGNKTTKSITIQAKYTAPEIKNLTPRQNINLQAGESVKIEFDSEPGLRATYVIHMPLANRGAKIANVTELPIMETTPGHYVGYYTATNNVTAEDAAIEVIGRDDFNNKSYKKAEGKLFINID